jgi:hypothetical protein
MAGKTFPGIGDLEDESPPLDPADAADSSSSNSQSHYSGPTVVDEAKVEQGLKKLRSLDAPPGPLTGIHQAIADVLDDPARTAPQNPIPPALLMPEITIDPARGTAVGRSVSGPVVGQQTTQPFDDRALRGTMFGHGVHLPDLEEARRAMLVETSKALAVVERGVPTTNEITVFQPGTYPQRTEIPLEDEPPFPRSARFHPEDTPIELRTVVPRKKLIIRVVAAGACIAAIVVAALLWVRSTDEAYPGNRSTTTIPASQPTRPVEVRPVVAPLPTAPAPQPAAIASPPPTPPGPEPRAPAPEAKAPARKATAAPSGDDDPAATAVPVEAKPVRRPHAVSTHSDRHHSPSSEGAAEGAEKLNEGTKPDKAEAPTRPTRGKRPIEEDPDATMAPTIE